MNGNGFFRSMKKENLWIVFLSFIILFPNLYLAFAGSEFVNNLPKQILLLVLSFTIFLLPALLLKTKVFFFLEGIFVVLAPLEIGHINFAGLGMTSGFLTAILQTHQGEVFELLSSMKIALAVVLVIWVVYFFIVIKKIKNRPLFPDKKVRLALFSSILLIWFAVFAYCYKVAAMNSTDKKEIMDGAYYGLSMKLERIYPYDLVFSFGEVTHGRVVISRQKKILEHFSFHAEKKENPNKKEIYIVIIGESARYGNFSINGYEKPTNPLLEKTDNLVSLSDFYAEANLTSFCLPLILTRATPVNFELYYREKSFPEAFKEAGFKVYWLTNQSLTDPFVHRIAEAVDGSYFNYAKSESSHNYDTDLGPHLDKILNNNDNKVLIILHTKGSHFRYNYRYPPEYNIFRPSYESTIEYLDLQIENRDKLLNTYDNSILFADFFISNTIRRIDSLHVVSSLLYFSDHGENFGETKDNLWLHSGLKYSKYDLHIPFFVWYSDCYKETYPSKIDALHENKDKKINASSIFYSVLDAADITFSGQNLQKSFMSPLFEEDSVRYMLDTNKKVHVVSE